MTLEDRPRTDPPGLALSRRERAEAWAITGPPGRAWSFARDLAAAAPLVARWWAGRAKAKILREPPRD
jgi:hypothetical protein